MALPPLPEDELRHDAQLIATGTVLWSYEMEAPTRHGTDLRFVAPLILVEVESGPPHPPGEPLYVHYREPGARPAGWTGDAGQHLRLPDGAVVRVFVVRDENGLWQLLEPNGWRLADVTGSP